MNHASIGDAIEFVAGLAFFVVMFILIAATQRNRK